MASIDTMYIAVNIISPHKNWMSFPVFKNKVHKKCIQIVC